MFNTCQNNKMVEVLSGPERRQRRTSQKKSPLLTMVPAMTLSHVARLYGINANLTFKWRRQYDDGYLTAVALWEEVVPDSELAAENKQIRKLQRILWRKRRWKLKSSKRLLSSSGQKNGLRMRPCYPETTNNRRQLEHWCIACTAEYQDSPTV